MELLFVSGSLPYVVEGLAATMSAGVRSLVGVVHDGVTFELGRIRKPLVALLALVWHVLILSATQSTAQM